MIGPPLKLIPKFVDLIVNGIQERLYALKAEAIDSEAANKRLQERQRIKKDMIAKPLLEDAMSMWGIDMFSISPDKLPYDEEELGVYMETEFKLPIEVAIEKGLKLILEYNEINTISERVIRDLVELGIGGVRHYTDPMSGIKTKYVNPEFLVHSQTDNPDFKGAYYFGEVERVPISELKRTFINNGVDWDKVKTQSVQFNAHMRRNQTNNHKQLDNFLVDVLHFTYQTSKEIVFKQKMMKGGAFKMQRRDNSYNPSSNDRYQKRISQTVDTWMEGVLILGTDILLDWKEGSNIIRPKGLLHNPVPNFVLYAPKYYNGEYDSFVGRQIPFADQFQLQHMKLQQLVAKIYPDGLHFDVDGLQGIDLGDGGVYTPKEAMKLYVETGNTVGRSIKEDGYSQNSKPVQPNHNSGQSDKIRSVITSMNFYMGQMIDSIGANGQATNPDSDALVGVQKIAALNSNQATRHIKDAILNILQRLGTGVLLRFKDAWEYSEFKDFLINGIGQSNFENLAVLEDLNIHDLAIFMSLRPDEEEKMKISIDVTEALKAGQIQITDKIDILNLDNFKEQSKLLKVRIKRHEQQKSKQEAEKIKLNEQSQINIATASSSAKNQSEQLKHDLKIKQIEAESMARIRENAELSKQKSLLMDQEFALQAKLTGELEMAKVDRENLKEDRKDSREEMKDSRQSQLSYQRKNNLPPTSFESKFDTMDSLKI